MASAAPRTFSREGKETLQHFTHPHILTKEVFSQHVGYQTDEFLCDACHTLGSGTRYRSKQCDFDIHENCADCPEYLNTFIHPKHRLELMWEGSKSTKKDYGELRPCDVCGDPVKGLFYICSSGAERRYENGRHSFFIHPLCSKFPSQVHHAIDEKHHLKFQSVPVIPYSLCAICGDVVLASSWSYRCDPCGVNIHLECITLPFDNHHTGSTTYSSRSPMDPQEQMHQQKGPVHPPPTYTPYGDYTGKTPFTPLPAYNNYCPPPYNYYPYPPPNYNYYYPQPPQPYEYPPTPPPPYYNHHPPHAPPKKEATGGKRKRSAAILGRIAVSLFFSAATAGVIPIG
ncbi:hypothetical protein MKW94_027749 [Papaver nudicaule]|uniref:Phorbol-ester/DAG-type domain-containing protein n=1 Tax=Papaver nudicaule TaxID=74823 RepID=A0AA41UZ64_PAPNU|nr:hypothetical protein [Papaver nudicaule]